MEKFINKHVYSLGTSGLIETFLTNEITDGRVNLALEQVNTFNGKVVAIYYLPPEPKKVYRVLHIVFDDAKVDRAIVKVLSYKGA